MVRHAGIPGMITDWECFDRARGGDQGAWRILFQRYHSPLVRMTSLITGSVDTARDLTQECFVRLVRSAVPHREGSFRSYISTIAYRLALKEKSRSRRILRAENDEITGDGPSPLEWTVSRERTNAVEEIIQSLPGEQRDIIALRFYGGHTYEEIAEIVRVPLGTVKSRIFYAVKACRQKLSERGISS